MSESEAQRSLPWTEIKGNFAGLLKFGTKISLKHKKIDRLRVIFINNSKQKYYELLLHSSLSFSCMSKAKADVCHVTRLNSLCSPETHPKALNTFCLL